jgi:cytochrome b6-f complex iron-sulfur subunit
MFVCRDDKGVYAMDAQCSHLGCTLSFVSQAVGFSCGCHNSGFDYNGQNPIPPATVPLKHLAVCQDADGNLLVDPDAVVDASVRYKA